MPEFRRFTDQMEYSGEPNAKVYASGKVRFNKPAGDRWFRGVDRVEILVDDSGDTDELAFRPVGRGTTGTYSYNRDGDGNGGVVSIRSVLSYYGVSHERIDEAIAVDVRYDGDTEAVVVDLSDVIERHGRPSMRRATG